MACGKGSHWMKSIFACALVIAALTSTSPARADNFSDSDFCESANSQAKALEQSGPQWVDQVTRMDAIAVDCDGKAIAFKKFVKVKASDMQQGWQAQMQQAWNQIYCQDQTVAPAIENGWTVKVYVTLADNASMSMTVACGEQQQ